MKFDKIFSLFIIFLGKGLSIAGFIGYSILLDNEEFRIYSFYFASYQIISQIIALQLPIATFRYSHNENFISFSSKYFKILLFVGLLASLIIGLIKLKHENLIMIIAATSLLTSFQIGNEYIRGKHSERLSFILSGINGISYIIGLVLLVSYISTFNIDVRLLIKIELCFLIISNIIVWRFLPKNIKSFDFIEVLKEWKIFSLGLYLNGIVWYFYFNLPFLIFQSIISSEDFTSLAQFLRINNGLSTASAMLALVYQKETLKKFVNLDRNYSAERKITIKSIKAFLLLAILLIFIFRISETKIALSLYFIPFLLIFLALYFLSNLLIAEKRTFIISISMVIGFFLCSIVLIFSFLQDLMSNEIIISSIFLGLAVTLILRIYYYEKSHN